MICGVIFDLDGVLVSTDRFHYMAWKSLADKLGVDFDEKRNDLLRGVSRRESLEIILQNYKGVPLTEEQKISYMKEKNTTYRKMLQRMIPADVPDDTRKTLVKLRQHGYLLAVGSSSKNAGFILQQTDMEKYFDAIVDGNQITHSKPHPEVFQVAAESLGLAPEQCIVVEDAVSGIQAAKAAGIRAIYMGKKSDNADQCTENFASLFSIIEEL